jgi:Tfp pilus assembly protein FimT
MSTPLLLALAALMVLIAVPASRDLFNAMRERNERNTKTRLVPIRIDRSEHERQRRDR